MRLRAFLFGCLLVAAGPLVTAQDEPTPQAPCEGFTFVEGLGPSCPVPGGWRVLLRDGSTVLTHGHDPKPGEFAPEGLGQNSTDSYPPLPPVCANSGKAYLLIYMVPFDKTDRYATYEGKVRDMVQRMNGHLRLEAQLFADDMSYRFRCDPDGRVHVEHVVSSVPASQTDRNTFSEIVSDLRSKGYTRTDTKYLVFWDNSHCCAGGTGTVRSDDRLSGQNANNDGASYAVDYGYTDGWGMMTMGHEIGHNLGAVQLSSPNSSGGWHCNDGQDTMCYKDSASAPYNASVCTDREHYDCNHDDYFNPSPAPGSYLATHWNLASRLNEWFDFTPRPNQAPIVESAFCLGEDDRVAPNAQSTCIAEVYDPDIYFNNAGGRINLTFDWGDGNRSTVGPFDGTANMETTHAWAAIGNYTVTVTATDDGVPPLSSAPFTFVQRVSCAFTSTGQLVVGLAGIQTPFSARTIAIPPCWGEPYALESTGLNDFDACWYQNATLLGCDRQEGNNAGTIPEGATHVRVVFFTGAAGLYRLTLG